jgi:hypothetical protein
VRHVASIAFRVRRALRRHGLLGTVRKALAAVRHAPARLHWRRSERAFDAAHAIDTAGVVHLHTLDIASGNAEHGVRYEPTNPEWFRDLVDWLPIDYEDFVFVDYGAGKGRALVLASEFPFKRIVGVEFSPELAEVAKRNVAAFRSERQQCDDFEVVCIDAVEYEVPDEPCVLYFYNPFAEPILRRVLASIRDSVAARPRPVYVVVTGDAPLRAIVEEGFASLAESGQPESHALRARRVFVPATATIWALVAFFARGPGPAELCSACGL